jgi:hypothetical protein
MGYNSNYIGIYTYIRVVPNDYSRNLQFFGYFGRSAYTLVEIHSYSAKLIKDFILSSTLYFSTNRKKDSTTMNKIRWLDIL